MAQQWNFRRDRAGWAGAIAGAFLASYPIATLAQVTGDGTLGTQVNGALTAPCTGTCIITNGATKGSNLFHSLRQFSLPNGDFAGFVTTPAIQNVIVRVTGVGQPFISNINGTIATINAAGTAINPANFFLLNPNGIIFGPNASLLIGGSFLATTANRMQFADGAEFNTADPAPLLTISVPTGLQFGQTPGEIQMQGSFLSAGQTDSFSDFALVGGDVILEDTIIVTPGRRVELGGVAESGNVGLTINGNSLSLSFSEQVGRSNVSLSGNSRVQVAADNSGSIAVNARNIDLTGRSVIDAGILPGAGSVASQAGNITLKASGSLKLAQRSLIRNVLFQGATGNTGDIIIRAQLLQLSSGSQVFVGIFGQAQGNAGDIDIQASNTTSLDGISAVLNSVQSGGIGKGGNISITTGSLAVTNGAQLVTGISGTGDAGNITIIARNNVTFDRGDAVSSIGNPDNTSAKGRGGDISISAESLSLFNGSQLTSSISGIGNAGNIFVNIQDTILLDGQEKGFHSAILSNVQPTGRGNGGDIYIAAEFLRMTGKAVLGTDILPLGQGDAGSIFIDARKTVILSGLGTGIASGVGTGAIGQGGDIYINTGSLFVSESAQLQSLTRGQGNAGNIVIQAREQAAFDGVSSNGFPSGAFSDVEADAIGEGGDIDITAPSLSITNSAKLGARTDGKGDAGNIFVTADVVDVSAGGQLQTTTSSANKAGSILLNVSDRLTLSGANTGLFANTALGSSGNGGSIFINPRTVTIQDGARVAVDSQGSGTGGNIAIQAGRLELRDRGSITAETASAQGGNITLDVKDLILLRRNSLISATAGTAQSGGDGGNITIRTPFIVGVLGENSDITANAFQGNGGNINITTNGIYGLKFQPKLTPFSDITASSQFGINGTVTLNLLNVDPSRGLVALPIALTDPSQQISQNCTPGSKTSASSFVATGRGGIPLSPDEPLEGRAVVTQWVLLPEDVGEKRSEREGERGIEAIHPSIQPSSLVEAQSIVVGTDGTVELVANHLTSDRTNVWLKPAPCQVSHRH